VKALIFDCDGVLADTERDGHLPAFNQTFREMGLPVEWSPAEYGELLSIAGGKERMRTLLGDESVRDLLPSDPDGQLALIASWHARKTEIFTEMVRGRGLPARPGVRRIIREASEAGWLLAVASTSAEPAVRAILDKVAGPEWSPFFTVLAGDVVPRKKPAPDIYVLALQELRLDPADALVIEDSQNGLQAATGADVACVVTVSSYTAHESFPGAALVVTSLGDQDGARTSVVADPLGIDPGPFITLADLDRCRVRWQESRAIASAAFAQG
jgi:HAD superfamily hydrolase (TIGR01509 family)